MVEDTLYVSGRFSSIGGQARSSVAAINMSDGSLRDWNPEVSNVTYVYAISVTADSVYIAGDFSYVEGELSPNLGILPLVVDGE